MKFIAILPQELDSVWLECHEILSKSFGKRNYVHCVDDYYSLVKNKEAQLWVAIHGDEIYGAALTVVSIGSTNKICEIVSLAGKKLRLWIGEMEKTITDFAKANGCVQVDAITRRGFSRFAPSFRAHNDAVLHIKLIGN